MWPIQAFAQESASFFLFLSARILHAPPGYWELVLVVQKDKENICVVKSTISFLNYP